MGSEETISKLCREFDLNGEYHVQNRIETGIINDTFLVAPNEGEGPRCLLQKINDNVFKKPVEVMENIARICSHMAGRDGNGGENRRDVVTLVANRNGSYYAQDDEGGVWRLMVFIEKTRSYDIIENEDQAFAAARAFGAFQLGLSDLPEPRLHETIVDFHHTPKRFEAFEQSVGRDAAGRAASVRQEIEKAFEYRGLCDVLIAPFERGEIPERITHNDTKINNVLFDLESDEALCVIDLDTVMPGLSLYDFGDMARTATSPVTEDDPDIDRVEMRFGFFQALARGYTESMASVLKDQEWRLLPKSAQLITYEQYIRFLMDYIDGDTYYQTNSPDHNLIRSKNQLRLLESMLEQEEKMSSYVETLRS